MAKGIQSLSLVALMTLINSGGTTESICSEYSCTEEEFRTRLSEICTRQGTIEGVLADIARNEKKGTSGRSGGRTVTKSSGETSAPDGARKLSSPELNALIAKEADLTSQIGTLETRSNDLLNRHYANAKELRNYEESVESARSALETARAALEAARAELEKQQEKYDESANTDKQLTEEIASVKESQQTAEKELEETRAKIYELTHATLRVLEDGSIEQTSGKTEVVLDDSGSDVLFKELSEKEEYEDLPVKKVRILAKLFKIVEHSNVELEINCDDAELNRAYRSAL